MQGRYIPRFLILVTVLLCVLSSCGAPGTSPSEADKSMKQEESSFAITAESLASAVINQTPVDNMTRLEPQTISLHYDFDLSLLSDCAVYMSARNTSADEVAIFFLKQDADSQTVIRALNAHIQLRMQTFQTLAPAEYQKLSHARLLSSGNYIALLVCPKIDTAYSILLGSPYFLTTVDTTSNKKALF
ncbi:MAG TPA: DUF4358 domain-containing protein [Candidatus Fimivicinus intestinavium]|nr:DUF4358 domain-containing protein [Candidatus Fimivicinus intestinavium]